MHLYTAKLKHDRAGTKQLLAESHSLYRTNCSLRPREDSGVERIDPLRFLAGCRKSRLINQALSVPSVSLVFFLSVSIVLFTSMVFLPRRFCQVRSLGCGFDR